MNSWTAGNYSSSHEDWRSSKLHPLYEKNFLMIKINERSILFIVSIISLSLLWLFAICLLKSFFLFCWRGIFVSERKRTIPLNLLKRYTKDNKTGIIQVAAELNFSVVYLVLQSVNWISSSPTHKQTFVGIQNKFSSDGRNFIVCKNIYYIQKCLRSYSFLANLYQKIKYTRYKTWIL